MSSIRFVKGEEPKIVKQGKLEYQAGKLSFIGRKSISTVISNIRKYLKDTYGWTDKTNDTAGITAQTVADLLLNTDSSILILVCDYTEKLKPADLLEWDEDFIELCTNAFLELNPNFKPKPVDTGNAQPETHNEDGTPKEDEEVSPLA